MKHCMNFVSDRKRYSTNPTFGKGYIMKEKFNYLTNDDKYMPCILEYMKKIINFVKRNNFF